MSSFGRLHFLLCNLKATQMIIIITIMGPTQQVARRYKTTMSYELR